MKPLIALIALSTQANTEVLPCMPHSAMVAYLAEEFGERQVSMAVSAQGPVGRNVCGENRNLDHGYHATKPRGVRRCGWQWVHDDQPGGIGLMAANIAAEMARRVTD